MTTDPLTPKRRKPRRSTRSPAEAKRVLQWMDDYKAEHDREPCNHEIAAFMGKSVRTVGNWKAWFKTNGLASFTRQCVSAGRSKLETVSRCKVHWETVREKLSTYRQRLVTLRAKTQRWMSEAAVLRRAIISSQPALYTERFLSPLHVPVTMVRAAQPLLAGSIWERTNQRLDERRRR